MSHSLINQVDNNIKSLQRLKLSVAAATTARSGQDIPDDLAKAFWKLILEGTACITFLRRICVDRQSRLSDESSSESESLSTLSEEEEEEERPRNDGRYIPWLDDTPSKDSRRVSSENNTMQHQRQQQSQLDPTARQNSLSSPSVSPQSSHSSFASVTSSSSMIERINPSEVEGPTDLSERPEPIAITQPLQPDIIIPAIASTVTDMGGGGGGSCAATIASLSDLPPELRLDKKGGRGEAGRLPRPQAYMDTAWMRFTENNSEEGKHRETVPKVNGRTRNGNVSGEHIQRPAPMHSRRSSPDWQPIRRQTPLFTASDDETTAFIVPRLDEEFNNDDDSSSSSGRINATATATTTSESDDDDEDYEPTAPIRDSPSSQRRSSVDDNDTPLTRSEKRRRKVGRRGRTAAASPTRARGHEMPRRRPSLVDQGVIVDSFNTEIADVYGVEVKPTAKSPRYIKWFDRRSPDPDIAEPAIIEMKRAEMPLHRKIFFLLEQRLPGRELPQAPLELLAAAFGRAKLGDLESDAVIAWIATQDPAKMTHRVCAAAVIGCGGRNPGSRSPNFIIRLFTTARDLSFGRRKVRVRGYGWGRLLTQEIERHLVGSRNCPYLLVESVAEAWGFWSHLGFELKSSRTTATSSSDTEGCCEFDAMRMGVYAQTLIGAKPVKSFR